MNLRNPQDLKKWLKMTDAEKAKAMAKRIREDREAGDFTADEDGEFEKSE